MGISRKEQIEKLDEKLAILTARKRELEAKEKEKERKERTRRLIQAGAIAESVFGDEITEKSKEKLYGLIKTGEIVEKVLKIEMTDENYRKDFENFLINASKTYPFI